MASKRRKVVETELDKFIERAMRELTFRTWQVLTSGTPVRTGFARAGWIQSVGAANPGP